MAENWGIPSGRSQEAATGIETPARSAVVQPEETVPRRYRRTPKKRAPRTWRTRKDPFEKVWPELRIRLQVNPAQTAKALFDDLRRRHPGQLHTGQLRTLQRRVREWRREHLYLLETNSVGGSPDREE